MTPIQTFIIQGGEIMPISLGMQQSYLYPKPKNMQSQKFNQNMPYNPHNKPFLENNLNAFIHMSKDNQVKNNQRLDSLEASIKRVKFQVGKLAEHMKKQERGKLPSQPK